MEKIKKLSGRQLQVMEVFWKGDSSLTISQVLQTLGSDSDMTLPVIRASVKALVKKKYLKESDVVRTKTVFAQSYIPSISKKEYLEILYNEVDRLSEREDNVIALVKRENDIHVLRKIEEIILEKKKRME